MAANALEEKINKIRLQNEEIKRRYEEVEADKKNAAKLNALVQMVPSSDWPERKEPPEFTRKETNKSNVKSKSVKEHSDRPQQYLLGGVEGKKIHKFAQGDGPPPDPKYNFLADSEREENNVEPKRDEDKHRAPNKFVRNGPRKRGGGRDGYHKDHRKTPANSRDGHLPEYDAWRAERNRIDEARINRQRTAEGNWRREWDNDKANIEKESLKKDPRFSSSEANRRDYKEFEKRHQFEVEHTSRGRGGNHRGSHGPRTHGHYDNQYYDHQNDFTESLVKGPLSPNDDRTVIATDKSLKVTVNHGNTPVKGPVMSVKVNAPSIAGTGRVGPRQKTRVTYSSHAETEISPHPIDNFYRQKSFDEKTHFNNTQRAVAPKSPFATRRKENNKSPFMQRKDVKRDEQSMRGHGENIAKSPSTQRKKFKDQQKSPQGQMHFFTSTPQGIVSSRGRGQKRVNGAKNSVIKILGHADNKERTILHSESANINFAVVLVKSQQHNSEQFTGTQCDENLKNQSKNDENEHEIIADNFTTIEAENSSEDIKEATDFVEVSRDSQNEGLEELPENQESTIREEVKKFGENEEVKQFETSEETMGIEESERNVVAKEIEVLENSEELKIIEESENNKESENSKVLEKCEIEKIRTEEIEESEAEERVIKKIETQEREIEKPELKEKEIEKIEPENRKVEKNEPSDREIEESEPKERKIEKTELEKETTEPEEKTVPEEKIEPEKEKIEPETEKIEPEEGKLEPNTKEIEKIEPEQTEIAENTETPKIEERNEQNEIVDTHKPAIDNTVEKLPEQVSSNIEESTSTNNSFSEIEKVKNCDSESNETKIGDETKMGDHQQDMSKSEIVESVLSENVRESETKSDESSETVSSEISNEASCVPSE